MTTRRAILATPAIVAGAATLASGCQVYGGSPGEQAAAPAEVPAAAPPEENAAASAAPSGAPASAGAAPAGVALGSLASIPVGGGKIFAAQKVVVTQPQAGVVKAFSSICTHQGCAVSQVSGGTIKCPCHGSAFRVADGSVASGPAPRPLPPAKVTLDGDTIRLG